VRSFDIGWLTTLDVSGGWLFFYILHFVVGMPIPQYQEERCLQVMRKQPADNKVQ